MGLCQQAPCGELTRWLGACAWLTTRATLSYWWSEDDEWWPRLKLFCRGEEATGIGGRRRCSGDGVHVANHRVHEG